jgi:drug/metabolite transporter (DMT)-like permease
MNLLLQTHEPAGASKWLACAAVLAGAAIIAFFYLRRTKEPHAATDPPLFASNARPWRRLGAAICVLLAIMFVAGITLIDRPARPGLFIAFWLLILGLICWLCVLAIKDVLHTRKMVADWRARRRENLLNEQDCSKVIHKE